jgi:zinc protease
MLNRHTAPPTTTAAQLHIEEPKLIQLANGVPVFCFCNNSYDAMRLDLIFDAGTAFQTKKLLASTTNSMLKEGTQKLTSHQLASRLDYHGSYLDLSVNKDAAWITLFCLKRNLNYLLPLIKSMLVEPGFSEKDFEHLNNKQKNEFAVNSQKPKHLARREFNKRLFGVHTPYGQTAQLDDFDNLDTNDLKAFHKSFYHHANCRIIVSGPVDDPMMNKLGENFGDKWGNPGEVTGFDQQTSFQAGYHPIQRDGSLQSAIAMGKPMVSRAHPDYTGLMLLNTILGGYFGSRLMANIREDKGYTYGINSQLVSLRQAGYLQISTETGQQVTQAAIAEIHKELIRLQQEAIGHEELELVKNYITGSLLRSLDGPYAQAERFKSILGQNIGMQYFSEILQKIKNTNSDQLQRLAQQYLDPDSMLTVVVGEK